MALPWPLIAGNSKPGLYHVDEAIRRRLLLVPFTVRIPSAERDLKLADKLKAEWPAILRWILNGCLEWQRHGLVVPTIVHDATDRYLCEQDSVEQWLDDSVERDANAFTASRVLFASWKLDAINSSWRKGWVPNSAIKLLERLMFYCDCSLLSTPQSTRPVADSMSVELTTLTRITGRSPSSAT